ncbi:MAG TPA: DUF2508 family protein [Desulfobacteria bacterium]|nr:DUF2508 family protein [Desulfobacteria bacterium]
MLTRLKAFWSRLINQILKLNSEHTPPYNEEQEILKQLERAKYKLSQAWKNLSHADPGYIDLAVIEIHLAEAEYSVLNHKYRLLKESNCRDGFELNRLLPWLSPLHNNRPS